MSKHKTYLPTFLTGLETTGLEDGLELPRWSTFQNVRLDQGAAKRRPGMAVVAIAGNPNTTILDLNGSTDYVKIPALNAAQQLGRFWTLELYVIPYSVTGEQTILGFNHATAWPFRVWLDGTTLKVTLTNTSDTTETLVGTSTLAINTPYYIQVARNYGQSGNDTFLRINGTTEDSFDSWDADLKAPGGAMYVGNDNGSNFYDGLVDFVRAVNIYWSTQTYGRMRLPDPKAEYVLFDYGINIANSTTKRVDDRSRFRNHGIAVGSYDTGTGFSVQVSPVQLIRPRIDYTGKQRLDVVAGGKVYLGNMAR